MHHSPIRRWMLCAALALPFCMLPQCAAQDTPPQPANTVYPHDTKSIESTVAALYDVISGPAGARDWHRFEGLFIPEARLIFNGRNSQGEGVRRVMSPADYEKRAGEMFMHEGFFEREAARRVERFGTIAHVFSTYESRHEKDGKPFARGINSIQLAWDGHRWQVVTILWDAERPDNPLPEQYLH